MKRLKELLLAVIVSLSLSLLIAGCSMHPKTLGKPFVQPVTLYITCLLYDANHDGEWGPGDYGCTYYETKQGKRIELECATWEEITEYGIKRQQEEDNAQGEYFDFGEEDNADLRI